MNVTLEDLISLQVEIIQTNTSDSMITNNDLSIASGAAVCTAMMVRTTKRKRTEDELDPSCRRSYPHQNDALERKLHICKDNLFIRKQCDEIEQNKLHPKAKVQLHLSAQLEVQQDVDVHFPSLTDLPQELVLKVVSFIGPRCTTLANLPQLSKKFNLLMNCIGDAMLSRARSNFRILLPKLHPIESSLCLFMRHARCCHEMVMKCNELKRILEKNFIVPCRFGPIIVRSLRSAFVNNPPETGTRRANSPNSSDTETRPPPASILNPMILQNSITSTNPSRPSSSPKKPKFSPPVSQSSDKGNEVTMEEIDRALALALELICQDSLSYFLTSRQITIFDVDRQLLASERRCIIQHTAESLENQVLSLAGQCGGKVYKYMKMRHIISTGCNHLAGKVMECEDTDRMDRARLIMECVICRDLELAKYDAEVGLSGRRRFSRLFSGTVVEPLPLSR